MRGTVGAVLVLAGMAIGFTAVQLAPDWVVSAQSGWQCKSWTLHGDVPAGDDRKTPQDAAAIGMWLGQARNVQMSSNALDVAGRSNVVVCKQ